MMPKTLCKRLSSGFGVCTDTRAKFLPAWSIVRSAGWLSIGREVWIAEKGGKKKFPAIPRSLPPLTGGLNGASEGTPCFKQSTGLPPEQKEVITLKIWAELTFDEIARTLDLSLSIPLLPATATPFANLRIGCLHPWKIVPLTNLRLHERDRTIGEGTQSPPPKGTVGRL